MSHNAQALVQTCIDFRFRKALNNFIENELKLDAVDVKTDGGGIKKIVEEGPVRDWIFQNYDIAFNLHGVDRLVFINHQDCGAYGGKKAFANETEELGHHESQLKQAAEIVSAKYPGKQIEAYIALINDNQEISFKKVI